MIGPSSADFTDPFRQLLDRDLGLADAGRDPHRPVGRPFRVASFDVKIIPDGALAFGAGNFPRQEFAHPAPGLAVGGIYIGIGIGRIGRLDMPLPAVLAGDLVDLLDTGAVRRTPGNFLPALAIIGRAGPGIVIIPPLRPLMK